MLISIYCGLDVGSSNSAAIHQTATNRKLNRLDEWLPDGTDNPRSRKLPSLPMKT